MRKLIRNVSIKIPSSNVLPLSFTIYLEIVLSIKSTNQKHGGFDVTVSLFSWGHPLTTAHAVMLKFLPLKYLVSGVLHENRETVTSK